MRRDFLPPFYWKHQRSVCGDVGHTLLLPAAREVRREGGGREEGIRLSLSLPLLSPFSSPLSLWFSIALANVEENKPWWLLPLIIIPNQPCIISKCSARCYKTKYLACDDLRSRQRQVIWFVSLQKQWTRSCGILYGNSQLQDRLFFY